MRPIAKNCDHDDPIPSQSKSGEIWVNAFGEKDAQRFREQVLEVAEAGPDKPITVYVNSYGGYVDGLALMLDTMDETPNPFITVCLGKAMSAGAILLSHGDYRYCGRYARVMVHDIAGGVWGKADNVKNDAKEIERLSRLFMDLLAKNCGMTGYDEIKAKLRQNDGDELWMSPDAALNFGMVDYIGLPKLAPVTVYQIGIVPAKKRVTAAEKKAAEKKYAEKKAAKTDKNKNRK
jgi:ATP-dependent Clp protease protease subunit